MLQWPLARATYIVMFFQLTGALYLGFAGSLILGGLYWKRGTTAGAYAAMGVGISWAVVSFALTQYWGTRIYPWLSATAPDLLESFRLLLARIGSAVPIVNWEWSETRFPVTGAELSLINILLCITTYTGVSLLTCRQPFNLDRMLHRGQYAREDTASAGAAPTGKLPLWRRLTGINHEYTRGDRILAWSVTIWTAKTILVFLVVVLLNLFVKRWSNDGWFLYWKYYQVGLTVVIGTVTTVWFTWGGTRDLLRFFKALKNAQVNDLDDGRVIGHVSADDVQQVEEVEHRLITDAQEDLEPDGN